MEYANKVIITDCITGLGTEEYVGYLFHGLCIGGRCLFAFNEKEFEMMRGSYAIIRKIEAVHNVRPSKDFRVRVVYISPDIIELSTPQSNYGMRGQLALYLNPVMQLTDAQAEKCRRTSSTSTIAWPTPTIIFVTTPSSTLCKRSSSILSTSTPTSMATRR